MPEIMFFYLKWLVSDFSSSSLILLESKLLPCIKARCHQGQHKTSPFPHRKMDPENCPQNDCYLINIWFPVCLCQEKLNDAHTSNTTTPQPPSQGTSLSTSRRPSARMSGTPCVSTPISFFDCDIWLRGLNAHQQLGLDRWMCPLQRPVDSLST